MALIMHITRDSDGGYQQQNYTGDPMGFVIKKIPNGVPFKIYIDEIGDDNDVTEDFGRLQEDADFFIVEGAGGGGGGWFGKVLDPLGLTKFVLKLVNPKQATNNNLGNQQGESPNNSLTDRNNKPRPYERAYDICGTVQSIPNDLMTTYRIYNPAGETIEFGYYCVGRGYLDTPVSGITDGDTLLSEIGGSSAAVYGPYTSPNSGSPQTTVGQPINEGLYITAVSNEVNGITLKAPNELQTNIGDVATVSQANGVGTITDPSGNAEFSSFAKPGDYVRLHNIYVTNVATLSGVYRVISASVIDIKLDVTTNPGEWNKLGNTTHPIEKGDDSTIGPDNTAEAAFTQWFTISRIKPERLVANVGAMNGMYMDFGEGKRTTESDIEMQYQLVDDAGNPFGQVYSVTSRVIGRTSDEIGVSVYATLPQPSAVRVRVRRTNDFQFDYQGQIVDEIKLNNLYGQIRDNSPHYGNLTTVHTSRRQTPRATSVKQPQLKMVVTERINRYLGNGQFEQTLTNNTQAVQSLIRLLRDPAVGGLNLTAENMDRLLATQGEVVQYFGDDRAGQFCYTFDSYETTTQDIISTIADAIFCLPSRIGHSVIFDFERPRLGPEMVFTHRSKLTEGEKWTRNFKDRNAYDALKFSYINPVNNVKETINIPPEGGKKIETYDSKGVRNYQQAYWLAHRRYQKNRLNRIMAEFNATEEGLLASPGRPISVVKGSRVSPYDGYVVAVDGLRLVLSQNVEFIPGADHSVLLKRRDGSVQSVDVVRGGSDREVIMLSAPEEAIYTGNDALKTEFSFGDNNRHNAQMMIVSTVEPGDDRSVRIACYNYTDDYYMYDKVRP